MRSIAGLSKNVSPEDSAEKLRKAWEDQEKVYKKLQEREKKKEKKTLEEVARKNNERFQVRGIFSSWSMAGYIFM